MGKKPTNGSAETANSRAPLAIVKSELDLAWGKIQKGLQQEDEGHKLWIEGTLELINILDDARKRFGSDQAFGTWLTDNGFGENRITRHDRSALLNMAEHPDLTREVLEQTHRRSWRLIWEEEIQPRLPSGGQPAEAPTDTRRPKRNGANRVQKPEALKNIEGWYREQVIAAVNAVINELNKTMEKCDPELRKQLAVLDPNLLLDASQNLQKKAAEFAEWVDTPLIQAADVLEQKSSRVVVTKRARRASKPN